MSHIYQNELIHSTSPYLLQHAHNPVHWKEWNQNTLNEAKSLNKPIILSIGYSACHWCHVMERESFENATVAKLMNANFICIKVDREERPDVDQLYMDAIHAMGLRGGWPLNVFLTADALPFYGGTYFPLQNWLQVCSQVAAAYKNNYNEIVRSAYEFKRTLNRNELPAIRVPDESTSGAPNHLKSLLQHEYKKFDTRWGGVGRAPKFPMPSYYQFLLRAGYVVEDNKAIDHTLLTLQKMGMGGIFDHIGGGFARYSTDEKWLVPHFEKMLYDNAQLMSLYSEAYQYCNVTDFKTIVYKTFNWLVREMQSPEKGFYAALDADSEGVEGKYYIWTYEEVKKLLGPSAQNFCAYFDITPEGNWEHGFSIPFINDALDTFCQKTNLDKNTFSSEIENNLKILHSHRSKRVRPGLDDKIITSWNGLMITGLCSAYKAFSDEIFLKTALDTAHFLETHVHMHTGGLFHIYCKGKSSIIGFLEDYAFVIRAYIDLYQCCYEYQWLEKADSLMQYVLRNFLDTENPLFFFTDTFGEPLIARKKEIFDNVVPASNSVMAENLYVLGVLFDNNFYRELAAKMIEAVTEYILKEPYYMSQWNMVWLQKVLGTYEIAIVGPDYKKVAKEIHSWYVPNKIVSAAAKESRLPLLKDKLGIDDKTKVYICRNYTCSEPLEDLVKIKNTLVTFPR